MGYSCTNTLLWTFSSNEHSNITHCSHNAYRKCWTLVQTNLYGFLHLNICLLISKSTCFYMYVVLSIYVYIPIYPYVLDLAGMKLIFFTAAYMALFFWSVAKYMLITQWCFTYSWKSTLHQGHLCSSLRTSPVNTLKFVRGWEGTKTGRWLELTKEIFCSTYIVFSSKINSRGFRVIGHLQIKN